MRILATIFIGILIAITACEIYPRNTLKDCQQQCKESKKSRACYDFCDCIHQQGHTLDSCLQVYDEAPEDIQRN